MGTLATPTDSAIAAVLATGIPVHKGVIAEVIRSIPDGLLADIWRERGGVYSQTAIDAETLAVARAHAIRLRRMRDEVAPEVGDLLDLLVGNGQHR